MKDEEKRDVILAIPFPGRRFPLFKKFSEDEFKRLYPELTATGIPSLNARLTDDEEENISPTRNQTRLASRVSEWEIGENPHDCL